MHTELNSSWASPSSELFRSSLPRNSSRFWRNFISSVTRQPKTIIKFFGAIVMTAKPADTIDCIKEVADLTWDIRRERAIKAAIITLKQKEVVLDLLKSTGDDPASLNSHVYRIFGAAGEAERWSVLRGEKGNQCETGRKGVFPLGGVGSGLHTGCC